MVTNVKVGDRIKLLGLPGWLTHDLPKDERDEMYSFIGQIAIVQEIDSYGYFWLGFGKTTEIENTSHYSGHSFCVSREFIELEPNSDSNLD